jgi:uncharacterized membrane protein
MKDRRSVVAVFTAGFAALYTVGVLVLAPISFQVFQVRVADALLPLAILFGWPAILGLSLGAFVANIFGGLGPVDIIGGSIANLIAGYVAWRVAAGGGTWRVLAAIGLQILIVTAIVGTYLSYILALPLGIAWFGVLLGSIVAVGLLGSLLLRALLAERIVTLLRRHGLPVYVLQRRILSEASVSKDTASSV